MISSLKYKTELNLLLIFSTFAILFAFFLEYVLGHKPCNLCLLQRVPYILTIIMIILVTMLKNLEKLCFFFIGDNFFNRNSTVNIPCWY